jgi:hypothetical protein
MEERRGVVLTRHVADGVGSVFDAFKPCRYASATFTGCILSSRSRCDDSVTQTLK